ncbi:MAG: hypothetical protein Q7V88_00485, partial [Actinomycetota bacterium]|nr:hypothetical protein [Actinomycetota bacterium]
MPVFDKSVAVPMHLDRLISPRAFLWALRATWVALAVLLWQAINDATDGRTSAAGAAGAVAWGVTVAVVVVALVVPSALSLTVVRILVPAAVPAAVLTLAFDSGAAWGVAALAVALVAAFVALSAEAGEALVQGSAYGDEQRFPLRPPAALLLPMALTWLIWCAAILAGVVLLCAR